MVVLSGLAFERDWPLVGRVDELAFLRSSRGPRSGGAVLSGAPGVGKSRLASEATREISGAPGWNAIEIRVSAGMDSLPYAALRSALDVTPTTTELSQLAGAVESALLNARSQGRLLLSVDDAHLLDESSATLLHSLVARGDLALLLTLRSGLPVPVPLTALWKDGLVGRLELQALSRMETTELVGQVLDGRIEDSTIERLWACTEGNPLYLREVILASLETGALRQAGDEWRWRGRWAQSGRLREIVAERMGRLDPDETAAVEALAVGGPLPLDLMAALTSDRVVARLEARGLVTVQPRRSRPEVLFAHPVHAEVVRSRMPALQVRATCRNLADAMRRVGSSGVGDQVRLARWSLEAGIPVDPVGLRQAANATLWHIGEAIADRIDRIMSGVAVQPDGSERPWAKGPDRETVMRLATAAWEASHDVETGAYLAVALSWVGETWRAESVLEQLIGQTHDANDSLRVAIALAEVQFWGQRRVAEAIETLSRAHREATSSSDPVLRAEVLEDWGGIELNVGRPAAALERSQEAAACLGRELFAAPSVPAAAAALQMLGRGNEALGLIERALPIAARDPQRPLAAAQLLLARCGALVRMGRLEEGHQLAETCRSVALDIDSLDGTAVYGIVAGESLLQQGRPASASRRLRDAAGLLAERDVLGYRPWALAALARARAMLGDEPGAAAALADAERASVLPRYFDARLHLARATVHALAGRHDLAIAAADEGADWSARAGMAVDEALALDLRVRLDPTQAVADRLRGLTERTDSALVAEMADHASGLVRHDADALMSVGGKLASRSAWLMAAEAAAAAAQILESHHQERAARAAARQALEWAGHCEGARSALIEQLVAPSTLTRRELEVARLAAAGHSSKMIAERLNVSTRTVETHLYRSYTKLGITDRAELAAALAARDQ